MTQIRPHHKAHSCGKLCPKSRNTTNGSWWILQILSTKRLFFLTSGALRAQHRGKVMLSRQDLNYPPTSVGGTEVLHTQRAWSKGFESIYPMLAPPGTELTIL